MKKLLLVLIAIVIIAGCTQQLTGQSIAESKYTCPDGSIVTDSSLCPKVENQQEISLSSKLADSSIKILSESFSWTDQQIEWCKRCKKGEITCDNLRDLAHYSCQIPSDYKEWYLKHYTGDVRLECTRSVKGTLFSDSGLGSCFEDIYTNSLPARPDQDNYFTVCCYIEVFDPVVSKIYKSNEVCDSAIIKSAC